ncbi:acylphosphatase [Legionella lytica]|uniref:acylphosphatase n=1 Tax=Legionella lytica TaxID=96232 RepID=A0ABY4Y757_9GAMM|nr:acylphosphatase [Legionella lytica]USQ13405.1 acylphosphatase [Legionella lytica]
MNNQSCMHCFVSGKVQGVWYRASTKEQAVQLGINGWARNLPDGRVEVFACGAQDKLEQLYLWLQEGPRLAIVNDCSREDLPWEEYVGFDTF